MPEKPSNRAIVREWLVLDKRSLGLFRICLGLVLALDVILRGLHFRAHYTSAGVFPLDQYLIQPDLTLRRWSVFYMNDSALFVALLFCLFLIAALSLTVGYRTRLAGWVCWILILGVYRRNPIVNNAGDIYLPLLLMWGNFLPWNQAFAVDSKAELNSDEVGYSSFPGFCYLAQVGILYWFSAVLRVGAEWQVDGSALYYTLHLDPINTPFAPYALFMGTGLMALITKVTLFLELLGPLLLFVPSQYARLSGVLLIMSFHVGILATLAIPMFAIFCLLGPVGLLPALVWENRFGRQLAARLDLLLASVRARLPGKQILALSDASKKVANKYYLLLPYPIMGLTLFYLSWGLYKADVRSPLTSTLRTLSLDQRWGMFSPRPPDFMGWESAQARLASGRVVDLMTGEDYDAGNIKNNRALWNYRWRAFNLSLGMRGESHAQLYLQYLIRRWEETHPDDLVLSAQYLIHPRTVQKRFMLGEDGIDVRAVYIK